MIYSDDGESIIIEPTDQCFTCKFASGKKICTLMEALAGGAVYFDEDSYIEVTNCQWYEKKINPLKLVDKNTNM